ncbi:tannase/feruloyl esterase family alpha/beta hydrolase [Kribbella qitaiheensis]|uniref:Tannase/feruloyl esterase family alpha/beta hydrolase n=1 Tax=Kribbella qitaiheensis TaxID=1544730 RepID=A0A7G6X572_9ACTN|nr:tannase/feruloyl esterase family alpha/beta hydrolase [Kribbella qitaiheensis]QNE21387.1 tannase/feruloyl esterase family alpha/beta hydrolase [Kribbella qitaiheensis]
MHRIVISALLMTATIVTAGSGGTPATGSQPDLCAPAKHLRMPGAAYQVNACLADLTTAGTVTTGHTNPADYTGLTHAALPQQSGVPGVQIDGYFPDSSTTNTNHGWNHDSQFVLRLPTHWNGGLVVSGSPGVRAQYANDKAISDWVLAHGFAFAATDKGNTGSNFFTDGIRPGDAIVEWNLRMTQLTLAARATVTARYGKPPARTIAAGISNGGYLVRWQLENHPELYTRGVDLEGTLWSRNGPNLLTFLPPAIRGYERPNGPDHNAIVAAGFDPRSDFLWNYHYTVYWKLTQRIYASELDPSYHGTEADYVYAARPQAQQAVGRIALTGRIGRPLITLQGTLDSLLPITQDSDRYAAMVKQSGRQRLHTYRRIDGGNHVDGLVDTFPDLLNPLVPPFQHSITDDSRQPGVG